MTDDPTPTVDELALATFKELNRVLGNDSLEELDRELGCAQTADGSFIWETPTGATYSVMHGTAFCRRSVVEGVEVTFWRDGVELGRMVLDPGSATWRFHDSPARRASVERRDG